MTEAVAAAESPALPFAGTAVSFEDLYRMHFRDLSGYCAGLLDDDALGVDVAQEAFVRLFGRLRAVRDPRAWLFLVATNLVRDEWRRRARHRDAVEALRIRSARTVAADDGAVLDAVRRLPGPLAEVVLLHYFADLRLEDVAVLIRRPLGTVKRRLHDARGALHDAIGGTR